MGLVMVDESASSDIAIGDLADRCMAVFGGLLSVIDDDPFVQLLTSCLRDYLTASLASGKFEAPARRDIGAEELQKFRDANTHFKEIAGRMSVDLAVELGQLDEILTSIASQAGSSARAGVLDPDRLLKILSIAALAEGGPGASEFERAGSCLLVNLDYAYGQLIQWAADQKLPVTPATGEYRGPASRLGDVVQTMRERDGEMAGDIAERMLERLLLILSRCVGRSGLTVQGRDALLSLTPTLADRALLDQDWLTDPDHPLQLFLSTAAQLACASEEADATAGRLKRLDTMLSGFGKLDDDDTAGIDRLAQIQQRFLKSRERREEIAQKRALEAARAQKRLEESRMIAARVIDGILKNANVSPAMESFLTEPWNNVIALMCVRHGADSPEAFAVIQTARTIAAKGASAVASSDLLDSLQMVGLHEAEAKELLAQCDAPPAKASPTPKPKPKPKPKQAASVSERPKEQASPPEATPAKDAGTASSSAKRPPALDEPKESKEESPPAKPQAVPAAGVRIVSLADQIQPGQWVEFRRENGMKLKAKLSWRNPVSKSLLFVDDRGLKVADRSMAEFARDLRVGDARLLELSTNR